MRVAFGSSTNIVLHLDSRLPRCRRICFDENSGGGKFYTKARTAFSGYLSSGCRQGGMLRESYRVQQDVTASI